jgi:LL-diaminopimelate aminotransferase
MVLNERFESLPENYLFSTIAQKVRAYEATHDLPIIRMGIGDVTRPLAPVVIQAMEDACKEMGQLSTFHGYDDTQGYPFLKNAISEYYSSFGASLSPEEIFVGDGAKSDIANLTDLFSSEAKVLIPDPVYPVYVDTNRMNGREIHFLDATPDNHFLAMPDPKIDTDLIYLCSPNNPTGATYTKKQLKVWVDYALEHKSLILFDAAYESFIDPKDTSLPRSIFEIEGAKDCAIEVCSLSKTAGFTGVRCGYTVIPASLTIEGKNMHKLWRRRQNTKFNGVSYITQKGAAAVFTPLGQIQCRETLSYYQTNARLIAKTMDDTGVFYTGGHHSPYIWLKCVGTDDSWEFFDTLLEKLQIVGTPGVGFGRNGAGFFRLSSFGTNENTALAMERWKRL